MSLGRETAKNEPCEPIVLQSENEHEWNIVVQFAVFLLFLPMICSFFIRRSSLSPIDLNRFLV